MNRRPWSLLIAIIGLNAFISCSKGKADSNVSARLSLLQHDWTSRGTGFYLPDGTPSTLGVMYYANTTWTFTADLKFETSNPSTSTSYRPYRLLPDDSTLIFTNVFTTPYTYDTNYITSLTEHELIFHGFYNFLQLATKDTLRR